MVKRNTTLIVIISIILVSGLFAFAFLLGGQNLVTGNLVNLALVENFRDLNCEAWNELAITQNGVLSVVGSGRQGFNPTFESSFQTLSITDGTSQVEFMHVRLLVQCSGNFIKQSDATLVSGSFNFQLCGDPQQGTTVCFQGSDRSFTTLEGSAVGVQTFINVPILEKPLTDDEIVILFEGDISAFELEKLFDAGDGTIHFKSTMFPILTWTFFHPTLGIIVSNYNAITANQPVIAQYGQLRVADVDTDQDGIFDLSDGCINEKETFNNFQDEDGCPDTAPEPTPEEIPTPTPTPTDSDGDGIEDVDDLCPNEFGTLSNGCPEVIEEIEIMEPPAIEEIVEEEAERLPVEIPPRLTQLVCPLGTTEVLDSQGNLINCIVSQPIIIEEGLQITFSDIIILMIIAGVVAGIIIIVLRRTGKI